MVLFLFIALLDYVVWETFLNNIDRVSLLLVVVVVSSSHQSPSLCFAVSVGAVHSDSTVSFDLQSKRWWVSRGE